MLIVCTGGIAVFIEANLVTADAGEVHRHQVLEQKRSVDGGHVGAQSRRSVTDVLVHVMQAMGQRIDWVDDKAHFGVLFVTVRQFLIACVTMQKKTPIQWFKV